MAGTRRSTRLASSQESPKSSPTQQKPSPAAVAGTKRKPEPGASPSAKRGRKAADGKGQKTIEETMDVDTGDGPKSEEKKDDTKEPATNNDNAAPQDEPPAAGTKEDANGHTNGVESKPASEDKPKASEHSEPEEKPKDSSTETEHPEEKSSDKPMEEADKSTNEAQKPAETTTNGDNAVEANARDGDMPSSILEKGIIYFFYRGRVGIDEPNDVSEIARSYIVLRPLPLGAKLGDGPIGDDSNCCLLAIPKKVLPLSGQDKWTAFVETAKTSFKELKENFMKASDYDTQTVGTRHTPAASPAAEGVYAITSTGRETHLAYILTLPKKLGEVQKDLGLRERGSFITSVKNPQAPGPAYASLDKAPEFPKDILDEFRSLRWAPLQPKHLGYANTQFLLVGESSGLDKATAQQPKDDKDGKDEPKEEMEKLEEEDELRVKHLDGDHAVFADLGTDAKSYPGLSTTW